MRQHFCSLQMLRCPPLPKRFLRPNSTLRQGSQGGQLHGAVWRALYRIPPSCVPHVCANSWCTDRNVRNLSTAAVEEDEPSTKIIPFLLADIGEGIAEGEY